MLGNKILLSWTQILLLLFCGVLKMKTVTNIFFFSVHWIAYIFCSVFWMACFYVICISGYDFNFNSTFTDNTMHVSMWRILFPADGAHQSPNATLNDGVYECGKIEYRRRDKCEHKSFVSGWLFLTLLFWTARTHVCTLRYGCARSFIHSFTLVGSFLFIFSFLFSCFFSSAFLFIFHQRLEKVFRLCG